MSGERQTPDVGCYRLAPGIRLTQTENGGMVALCDYPLRVVPLKPPFVKLLSLCSQVEYTPEQLAAEMQQPRKRIEAWCEQLRWKSLLDAGPVTPPTVWPAISIVIPSYNRKVELERCLRALFVLRYPHAHLEVIVVDDASTDSTQTMLAKLMQEAESHELSLRCIRHAFQQGAAISRNTGVEAAKHNIIAYIDSDCVASPEWLHELVPLLQDSRIAAVGGMIRGYERRTLLGRYEDVCSSLYMGAWSQQVRLNSPLPYLPTANLLVRRSIWQELGGFAPLPQGEDVDFCRRILLSGAHIRYEARGVVYHDYRTTLTSFLKIRATYASAEAPLLQRHPTERRILLLPPEQATFAGLVLGSVCGMLCAFVYGIRISIMDAHKGLPYYTRRARSATKYSRVAPCGRPLVHRFPLLERSRGVPLFYRIRALSLIIPFIIALFTTLFSTRKRLQKIRQQHISINPVNVFKATLRGNLAYTYHMCRHITRYYTLLLLLLGVLVFPIGILIAVMLSIVVSVDYWRLKPHMNFFEYAFCAILSDCAYEIGVLQGCIKHRTWKPLIPIIRKRL